MGELFHAIAVPLYWVISGILVFWHKVFAYLPISEGWAWALAIVGLTVTIRAALIPVFVKQIKAMRAMQLIQPEMKALQKKHGHDRERLAQETMKLYKESGTNPFASCLPLVLQMPIFFALFALLRHAISIGTATGDKIDPTSHIAFLSHQAAIDFASSHWLGTVLGASLTKTHGYASTQVIAIVLVIAMIATQFLTQRQIMSKNMPPEAMSGQYAQQQKIMLYVLPFVFALGSFGFPIGLMLYWTSSNVWTMAQQYTVIKASPTPGSPAALAKAAKAKAREERLGTVPAVQSTAVVTDAPAARTQPKRLTKAQRQAQAQRQAKPQPDSNSSDK